MEQRQKRCLGSHIRDYDELEELIFFITRHLNHKHIKYTIEYNIKYEYYKLWFWLTNKEYISVCRAYYEIELEN